MGRAGMAEGAGMAVGEAARVIGARCDWCAGSRRLTPHLTSPLEGGRDALGMGGALWFLPAQE